MRNARYVLLAAGLLVVLSVLVAGCGRKSIATVNGEAISKEEFYNRLERYQFQTPTGPTPQAGIGCLNDMINEKLIEQLAKDKNATPTEEQINAKLNLMQKEGRLKGIEQAGITKEDIKHQIWLHQASLNIVTKGEKATEKEARDFYEANRERAFSRPEQVQIGIIAARERKKIDDAAKLIKDGQEFSTVAMRFSEDELTKRTGGTVGPVARDDKRIPEIIRETAFTVRKGQVSDPFQIPDEKSKMWYLLKALDRMPARTQSFAEVKGLIMDKIRLDKAISPNPRTGEPKVNFSKMLETYRKKAKIDVRDKKYQNLAKTMSGSTPQK